MDRALLRELGLSHRDFAAIVRDARGDEGVLAAIGSRDPGAVARARAWSAAMPGRNRLFLWVLDVDDGYRTSRLGPAIRLCANALSHAVKRVWPSRAAERTPATDAPLQ